LDARQQSELVHSQVVFCVCSALIVMLQTEAQFKSVTKKKTEEQFQQLLD
jgi:hypothetical protein